MNNVIVEANVNAKWSGFKELGSAWKNYHLQIIKLAGKLCCQLKAIHDVEKKFVLSGNIKSVTHSASGCIISLQDQNQIVLRCHSKSGHNELDKIVHTLRDIQEGKLKACGLMSARERSNCSDLMNVANSPKMHNKALESFNDQSLITTTVSKRNWDRSDSSKINHARHYLVSSAAASDRSSVNAVPAQEKNGATPPSLKLKTKTNRKALHSIDQNIRRNVSPLASQVGLRHSNQGSLSTGCLNKFLTSKRKILSDARNQTESSTPKKFCNYQTSSYSDSKIVRKNLNMVWDNSDADNKKLKEIKGFANVGRTCYMNAVLQALLALHPFLCDLENKFLQDGATDDFVIRILNTLASDRKASKYVDQSTTLTQLKETIGNFNQYLKEYVQQDAHEFLSTCLDKIKEETKEVALLSVKDDQADNVSELCPVTLNFESLFIRQTTCNLCQGGSKYNEPHLIINLQLPVLDSLTSTTPNEISLQDLVKSAFEDEQVSCTCDLCKRNCTTKWSYRWKKLPRILILHLKRYEYNKSYSMYRKRNDSVAISRYLSVEPFCDENPNIFTVQKASSELAVMRKSMVAMDNQPSVRRQLNLENELPPDTANGNTNLGQDGNLQSNEHQVKKNSEPVKTENVMSKFNYNYRFMGVISHKGQSVSDGHYICDVFDHYNSKWISCDDSIQDETTESAVINERRRIGCIFFYTAWLDDL
ncbi:Ubiquitin carboxyl-terminal hydrolase 37 [Trichoplax sp. H2]|nr:Ubiquitin carboxyl-terminal hydrolase 37 [Trichoplax sp. H2]|eukprot:RDD37056.1 Ubiquitin carboxyl-terminal hydrolase 37 [Trichoplax sp. H2]